VHWEHSSVRSLVAAANQPFVIAAARYTPHNDGRVRSLIFLHWYGKLLNFVGMRSCDLVMSVQ
jgi:hypothetical protein